MSMPTEYFDQMYAQTADPWGFTSRWYEKRKYAITMASLPHQRYSRAFEPGCSIGVLSALLAERCDELLCADIAPDAVGRARERLSGLPQVRVERRRIPDEWPDGGWDLIVLSEVLYYLSESDVEKVLRRAQDSLNADGVIVAAHWRHPVDDYPRLGDDVHAQLAATPGLARCGAHIEDDFQLEVYQSFPALSVAGRTGLL